MTDVAASPDISGSRWRRRLAPIGGVPSRLGAVAAAALAAQQDRAFPWLAIAVAVGIVLFFGWPADPPVGTGAVLLAFGCVGAIALRRQPAWRAVAVTLAALGLGHGAAEWRTLSVQAPVLIRSLPALEIQGRVVATEARPSSHRIVLADAQIPGLSPAETPARLRLTVPAKHGVPAIGERIRARVLLRPPSRPVMPDGFQFQRFLYFEQIGAVGSTLGPWQREGEDAPASLVARLMQEIEALRRHIAMRVTQVVPDAGDAATTSALIMGDQGPIPEELQEAYRASGLAHLLSISGVHMSLLAAAVFFIVRRGLALVPAIALRTDTKKIAAWGALGATGLYVLISGLSVPAVRSFLMISVVLVAILMDRTALSLRTLAWAALTLMLLFPDAVVGASFQMSFLAVLALIAWAEHALLRVRWRTPDGELQIIRAAGLIFAGLVITDVLASGATALFAIYHFNRFPTYSMVANLIAGPITGLWVMPSGLVAMLLMPLGLDGVPLQLMAKGVGVVNDIARTVAGWPGAQVHVPPMNVQALCIGAFGLVFVCLWRGRGRWAGLGLVAAALLQPWLAARPDILIDENARVIAIADSDGHLVLRPGRTQRFVREVWTERYEVSPVAWTATGAPGIGLRCDGDGCILIRAGRRILIAFTAQALAEDCGRVDAVVAVVPARAFCRGRPSVDLLDLRRAGTAAIRVGPGGMTVRHVDDALGARPWNPALRARRRNGADTSVNTDAAAPPDDPEP
jgi:competence protein ComEC